MGAKIFVGNLNPRTTRSQLAEFFSAAGRVESVILPLDRVTGEPRGFCFVEFADREAAGYAFALCAGRELDGRELRPSWARERDGGGVDRQGRRQRSPQSSLAGNRPSEPDGIADLLDARWSDESADRRGARQRRHGKHGSDRRRRSGTRREIQ